MANNNASYSKMIKCNVHDTIRVSPTALKIINTPEFQRLRSIKQLGLCFNVYPSAMHSRFEHSLGTYHLAGKILDKIIQSYPNKEYVVPELGPEKRKLTHKMIECIKIGALCHDIGHGPFSHIFDDVLLEKSTHPNRHHEVRSCLIVEMLCKRELKYEFSDKDIAFIKSIINPERHHTGVLYQIVSNNLNGIDVDKFDYLERDSKNLGLHLAFSSSRLINEFIIDHNDNIAYPKHCSSDIYELFHSRYMMHKKVYCHKTVKLVELMLSDIFKKIDPVFKISEKINDMSEFCKLTDDTIFHYMEFLMAPPHFATVNLNDEQTALVKSAQILYQDIKNRKFYKQITELTEKESICKTINSDYSTEKYLNDFIDYLLIEHSNFNRDDFVIYKTKIGFVSGDKSDPFDSVFFYNKKEEDFTFTINKEHFSALLGENIHEIRWHLACKNREIDDIVKKQFKNYQIMIGQQCIV